MLSKARLRLPLVLALPSLISFEASTSAGVCPVPNAGAISGSVTATAGASIAGARMVLEQVIEGFLNQVATVETGPNGHYQFAAVPPGSYFVRTEGTELLVDEVWPGAGCDQYCEVTLLGEVVPVAAGESVEGIDFELAVGGRMEGVVRHADGTTPAVGARVDVYALGQSGAAQLAPVHATTNGEWFIEGLASGNYKARATAPGLLGELFPDTPCPLGCAVFTLGDPVAVVAGATTEDVDFALASGGGLSGTITDSGALPLEGVLVFASPTAGFGSASGVSGSDGTWSLSAALPPGDYRVRTVSPHLDEAWNDLPCEPFCPTDTGTPIAVGAGVVPGIDFALARLGSIAGTIVESGTREPLAGVSVVARAASLQFPAFAITGPDGSYRLEGLPEDSFLVTAGDGVHVGEIYDDAGVCHELTTCFPSLPATLVDVVGAGETPGIDFELDPGGAILGGVVVAATGAPVANASVALYDLAGTAQLFTFTSPLGRFAISGLPTSTPYRVVAEPPGGSSLLGELWEEMPCTPGNCLPDTGTPVPLDPAAPACVSFTLGGVLEVAGIAGSVVGENGPLAGAQLAVYDAAGDLRGTVFTDDSGSFLTGGAIALSAGDHYVVASANGHATELYDNLPCASCDPTTGTPVSVDEGTTTPGIDFELQPVGPAAMPLIFLEDCKPGGCVYFRGFEDSRVNRSSILGFSSGSLPEFSYPDAIWTGLLACVRRAYRPFGVEITDVDPGAVPHLEHPVAGLPADLGFESGTLGVSPFSCGLIPNSISFTFADVFAGAPEGELVDELCWTVVHEIAHQHGLDHHAYLPDAMTYTPGCGAKRLPDRQVPCGESDPEPCLCGGTTENSYATLRDIRGPSDFLFGDGFEVVEPGWNCGWSEQAPPPVPFAALDPGAAPTALRCGALDPSNPGFRPQPRLVP